MLKMLELRKTAFTALGAVAVLLALSLSAPAEASSNVMNCRADTARKVVKCCEQAIAKNQYLWLRNTTSTSCNISSVVCRTVTVPGNNNVTHVSAPAKKKICRMVVKLEQKSGQDRQTPDRPKDNRTPDNPQGGNPNSSARPQ